MQTRFSSLKTATSLRAVRISSCWSNLQPIARSLLRRALRRKRHECSREGGSSRAADADARARQRWSIRRNEHPHAKGQAISPHCPETAGKAGPGAGTTGAGAGTGHHRRGLRGHGPKAAGRRHQSHLLRCDVEIPACRRKPGRADCTVACRWQRRQGRHAQCHDPHARAGRGFCRARHRAVLGAGSLSSGRNIQLGPGLRAQRRGAADSVRAAQGCRSEAAPVAAAILRCQEARRIAQPRHQRRGQHRAEACSRPSASWSPHC